MMPLLVCMVLLLYDEELREREGGKESEREMVIVNLLIKNNN